MGASCPGVSLSRARWWTASWDYALPPLVLPCMPRRTDEERLQWLTLRMNQTEMDLLDAAAAREYLARATWVRQTLMREAHRALGHNRSPPEQNG